VGAISGTENLALTGIQSPDYPSLSESLYQLSFPNPVPNAENKKIKHKRGISVSTISPCFWFIAFIMYRVYF
jgi:hypothetical protein